MTNNKGNSKFTWESNSNHQILTVLTILSNHRKKKISTKCKHVSYMRMVTTVFCCTEKVLLQYGTVQLRRVHKKYICGTSEVCTK